MLYFISWSELFVQGQFMTENLALKAASLYAEGSTHADIGKKLEISRSRVGNLIREAIKSMEKHDGDSDEVTDDQSEGETEKKEEAKDEFFPFADDKDLDELMTKTILINATPILRKIALNSKVFLQHEYFQKQLGYEGDVGDLLVEALDYYWKEMGFTIKITHDMVM